MTDTRPAWLMDVGGGVTVAAGTAHVAEFLVEAKPVRVPRTPAHCAGVMTWRERLIPVIDLARLLTGRSPSHPHRHAVILAYQQAAGRPLQYGALFVSGAPTQTQVSDDMACALPETQPALPQIARSCFAHRDRPIAILDLRRLFDQPLAEVPVPEADSEPMAARPETGERVRVIAAEPVVERPPVRAVAEAVPYLRVVAPAAAVAIEPVAAAPAGHDVHESPAAPPEAAPAEAVDIEWPGDSDSSGEPAAVDFEFEYELPVADEAPSAADLAPLPAAPPETAVAASARAPSNTVRSFERLHDLERRHTPTERRHGRWLLAAAVVVVLFVIGVWMLTGTDEVPTADADKAQATSMVQDAASLEVHPASIPSTPAQPPN